MSFTGTGFLGSFGWGTTTYQALIYQEEKLDNALKHVKSLLMKEKTSNEEEHVDSCERINAAAFFIKDEHQWDEEKRNKFMMDRRKSESLSDSMSHEIQNWQKRQLNLLKDKQRMIESLDPHHRRIIESVADLISIFVINIHLREIMIYPLARDQLPNVGDHLFMQAVKGNEVIRRLLRIVKDKLTNDLNNMEWMPFIDQSHHVWKENWKWEKNAIVLPLAEWLSYAPMPDLVSVSGSKENPLPIPNPNPNHDLNYGQQLVQMFELLRIHHIRTGYFQGIPKSRHEPDWVCIDGFQPLSENTYGGSNASFINEPKQPSHPTMHHVPSHLHNAKVVEHPQFKDYPPIGESIRGLERVPDAPTPDDRKMMEKIQELEIKESQEAIQEAHKKEHGGVVMEKLENIAHNVSNSVDKAKSYFRWLTSDKHTDDLDGSFNKVEVNLALRNHGTHFEALGEDITPVGNHYLLIHFDVQHIKEKEYHLKVFGCVDKPTEWTLEDIKNLCPESIIRQPVIMECSGNGRTLMKPRFNHHVPWELQAFGCYIWTGIPIRVLLKQVGVTDKAVDVVFTGYDAGVQENSLRFYQRAVEIDDPVLDQIMICWENNGIALLREHGYPLRIVTPAWYGDNNVKWLQSIEVVDHKFKGRHMASYSYTKKHWDKDLAIPSQEIRPRAMIKPMGFPSFMERDRYITAGTHTWQGKAWVGGGFYRSIMCVEVSLDDGKTWKRAKLEPRIGVFAWHRFTITLNIEVGIYKLVVKATDSTGHQQKVRIEPQDWNWHGMCDDATQNLNIVAVEKLSFTT